MIRLLLVVGLAVPCSIWMALSSQGSQHTTPHDGTLLSIVLCGDVEADSERLEQMLQHTTHVLADALRGLSEVVFVSWDVGAKPRLSDEQWSRRLSSAALRVRVASVSHEEHLRYSRSLGPDGASVGYFEFECKNRALRLARGNFLLLTNVDILFSPCLIRGIVNVVKHARAPPTNVVWRAYRSDLHASLPENVSDMDVLSSLLESSNQTTLTRTRSGRIADEHAYLESDLIDEACGDFMMASRGAWARTQHSRGSSYFPSLPYTWHMDSLQMRRFRYAGVKQSIIYCPLYHRWHKKRNLAGKPRPAIPLEFLDRWSIYY